MVLLLLLLMLHVVVDVVVTRTLWPSVAGILALIVGDWLTHNSRGGCERLVGIYLAVVGAVSIHIAVLTHFEPLGSVTIT